MGAFTKMWLLQPAWFGWGFMGRHKNHKTLCLCHGLKIHLRGAGCKKKGPFCGWEWASVCMSPKLLPDFAYLLTSARESGWGAEIAAGWVAHTHYRSHTDQGFMSRKRGGGNHPRPGRMSLSLGLCLCKKAWTEQFPVKDLSSLSPPSVSA